MNNGSNADEQQLIAPMKVSKIFVAFLQKNDVSSRGPHFFYQSITKVLVRLINKSKKYDSK